MIWLIKNNKSDPDIIVDQELTDISGITMWVNELNTNGTLGYTYGYVSSYTSYGGLGNGMIYKTGDIVFTAQQELAIANSGTSPNGSVQFAPRANTVFSFDVTSLREEMCLMSLGMVALQEV